MSGASGANHVNRANGAPHPHHAGAGLAVLVAAAAIALAVHGILDARDSVTLYFPEEKNLRLREEVRATPGSPASGNREERAAAVIAELLLGPGTRPRLPLFGADVRIRAVLRRPGTLFVDLSSEALQPSAVPFPVAAEALRRSLDASAPGYGKLVLTIEGAPTTIR